MGLKVGTVRLEEYNLDWNKMFNEEKENLKTIFKDYKEIIEELEKYQTILDEEEKVINEFDTVASEIRKIQKEQKSVYEFILR